MKNQYFGDIYDYFKYGLLRQLTGQGEIPTVICWMLTRNNEQKDGHQIDYLRNPGSWSGFDPEIFDFLRAQVLDKGKRDVEAIEKSQLLQNTGFFSDLLSDELAQRENFFRKFEATSEKATLVFFDPDNGIEIKSVGYGKKKSSKYLYWTEIERNFSAGHSLLIYQHLPPKPRRQFIHQLAEKFTRVIGTGSLFSILTSRVAFLMVPHPSELNYFREKLATIEIVWEGIFDIEEHFLIHP